jgi:hypothetical protein
LPAKIACQVHAGAAPRARVQIASDGKVEAFRVDDFYHFAMGLRRSDDDASQKPPRISNKSKPADDRSGIGGLTGIANCFGAWKGGRGAFRLSSFPGV